MRVPRLAAPLVVVVILGAAACQSSSTTSAPQSATSAPVTAPPTTVPSTTALPVTGLPATATPVTTAPVTSAGSVAPPGTLPDPSLTPGAIDPTVTQANIGVTICVAGYTTRARPSVSITEPIKYRVIALYHDAGRVSAYELDHLIPLELGGLPVARNPDGTVAQGQPNLWPEPWEKTGAAAVGTGAETKDFLENWLHAEVCEGKMSLAVAQRAIASDWYAAWQAAGRPR
jgi:hypothetical protein